MKRFPSDLMTPAVAVLLGSLKFPVISSCSLGFAVPMPTSPSFWTMKRRSVNELSHAVKMSPELLEALIAVLVSLVTSSPKAPRVARPERALPVLLKPATPVLPPVPLTPVTWPLPRIALPAPVITTARPPETRSTCDCDWTRIGSNRFA